MFTIVGFPHETRSTFIIAARMINSIHSVHALVRLLKSPTDPPATPGPSKIEIACLAWSDSTFRAANKGEVIGEWILTLLGQATKTRRKKVADSVSDPVADPRYWTLLSDVLTRPSVTTARPIKTWLLPLLNRFQLDVVVTELLALQPSRVLAPAQSALTVLWPLAEKKISSDALGECLSAVFDACTHWERVSDDLAWICSVVVGAYRNALGNAGNKKKFYSTFLSTHLAPWLNVVYAASFLVSPLHTKQLEDNIYAAGIDTIFSVDALKQPLDTLFDVLVSPKPPTSALLCLLPRIFASFLNATHRHRAALFVTSTGAVSGKEEVRKMGMEFLKRCWISIQDSTGIQEDFNVERWRSIIGVFGIMEKERLFVPLSSRGTRIGATDSERGGDLVLSQARDKAVEMVENASTLSKDCGIEQMIVSIQLLDVLVRVEYDFVGSMLERVLSALIITPSALLSLTVTSSSEFLNQVLEYHTKTRTVHTYTLALLAASSKSSTSYGSASCTSTLSLAYHLPVLARALRTSLTPTQITPLATAALRTVESAWIAIKDTDRGEKVAKKRKTAGGVDESELGAVMMAPLARAFSFTSRIAGIILSNLPSSAYAEDGDESLKHLWEDVGKLGWTIVWHCLRGNVCGSQQARGGHGEKRKHEVETHALSTHYPHIAVSAVLRFLYDVRARVASPLGECDQLGDPDVKTLLDVLQGGTSDPELVLETIRTLFWHVWYTQNRDSRRQIEIQPIFTVTLDILATRISIKSKWSGMLTDLNGDNLGLAILYVLADRWIDVIDALGSPESLEKLVSLLLAIPLDLLDDVSGEKFDDCHSRRKQTDITSRDILFTLLQNAHFWELHNMRAVFLSTVMSLTAPLSPHCFPTDDVKWPLPAVTAREELTHACNIYRLLGHVPPEYFTRSVRGELIKRAMIGDVQICAVLAGTNEERSDAPRIGVTIAESGRESHTEELGGKFSAENSRNWIRRLTFVRAFLQRIGQFSNTTNHTTSLSLVRHLLCSPCISSPKALTNVTLHLIQLHVLNLLRSQGTEAAASISGIITTLTAAAQLKSQESWTHAVVQPSLFTLIERLTSDFDPASLSDEVKRSLGTLRDALESMLLPHVQRSVASEPVALYHSLPSQQIRAWSRTSSLTRWLGIHSPVISIPLGERLAKSIIRAGASKIPTLTDLETCSSIVGLLFEELYCMPDVSHRVHLDTLVGFYVVNGDHGSDQMESMDTCVAQGSKKLSAQDFSCLLDIIAEGIGGGGLTVSHREHLIRLGVVILHDPPQGTLKVIQNFATQCLDSFVDRDQIYGGPSSLRAQCLEFTARHCSDRPVAIRPVDLGSIWSFINRILSGSPEHDSTTAFPIFHYIIAIVSALIRLRRDLIVHTLPHLSLVLRQLMMLTRKIRPQLGAKQSKIVTDTFPSWISASQPISTDEARALARLLTSFTTKTVPRTHAYGNPSSTESPKAESLAKPFAKHASYVLVAYVDAFNDPLCIINAEMRRELEPGLFALCEMVGEHSRDALMMSTLNSGGKTIMKSLWRDYEKQRYVGKG